MFLNLVLIPTLITLAVESTGLKQKSIELINITEQIHFFMILNTLILPFTEIDLATRLFDTIQEEGVLRLTQRVSMNILSH